MMREHPIEGLMRASMASIQDMIDVNTIIGDPIETNRGVYIIPISKVSFGFAAGGSEFNEETIDEYTKKEKEEMIQYKLPFGGGSGAGVSINPVAFLVIQESNVKLLPICHTSAIDKLLDYIPDLFERVNDMMNNNIKVKIKCDNEKKENNNNDTKQNEKDNNRNKNSEIKLDKKETKKDKYNEETKDEKEYTYEFEYEEPEYQEDD